jgi:hypothetical protein
LPEYNEEYARDDKGKGDASQRGQNPFESPVLSSLFSLRLAAGKPFGGG